MKTFATEVGLQVTRMVMDIFGGIGVMKDAPLEKLMRDVSVFPHLVADVVHLLTAAEKL